MRTFVLALALALANVAGAATSPPPAAGPQLTATRELVTRLARSGRGEAPLTVTRSDPMGGPDREDHGQLALEPPDRVRLDFKETGERIALRSDGGEWVQPAAKQLVRIQRDQAGLAAWLWEVFLRGGSDSFAERASGERRYVLEPRDRDAGLPGQITVSVDSRGLPTEARFVDSDGVAIRYRFRGWSFRSAKGPQAFTLSAPRGYAIVDLP